jgi:hypothetical protein
VKSLWKWAILVIVAISVVSFVGSQAQQAGWSTQQVAQGADAANKRVVTPDVAVGPDGAVYVSWINQAEQSVNLAKYVTGQDPQTVQIVRDNAVVGTTVAAGNTLVCVAWEELGADFEIWQSCWQTANLSPVGNPVQLSTGGAAGQANGAGWGEFGFNFDNTIATTTNGPDKIYAIWVEEYATPKAAWSNDGINWQPCGDIPDSNEVVRYPTIYVDSTGRVWAAIADIQGPPPGPDIFVWFSDDQCASWQPQTKFNLTPTGLYSDGPGIVRLGDKLYEVNDDDAGAAPQTADIHLYTCDITASGLENCRRTVVHQDGGFPHIATDGKGLYVTSFPSTSASTVKYSYSCDAGQTWTAADVPGSAHLQAFRHSDFGAVVQRTRIATSAGSPNVYIVWGTRGGGQSSIMLGTRPKDCP